MTITSFDIEAHVQRLTQDGYTIIEDFADAATLAQARQALAPHLGSHHGRNSFEGFATERVYTLVARGPVFERLTEEPRLLALLDRFLQPGYLLTASQAICIYPGEQAQGVHTDDSFYRQPRPRPADVQFLQADDIRLMLGDDRRDPPDIQPAIDADAAVDIVGQQAGHEVLENEAETLCGGRARPFR